MAHAQLPRTSDTHGSVNSVTTTSRFDLQHTGLEQLGLHKERIMDSETDLVEFDDGHTPGATEVKTKLAVYKNKYSNNFFSIYDNLLPEEWCDRAYQYAFDRRKPWGAYITTADALDLNLTAEELWKNNEFERAVALIATRKLIFERAGGLVGTDKNVIHGTAVWCLCSDETDSVQYHIDYAELYRYETNVIYPPLYAGTCQVSPVHGDEDMVGGDFQANVRGIEHYRQFGYKGKLASKEDQQKDQTSADWITARYRRNRGIMHDGNFPHLSTPVTHLKPGCKRVILGFNCFSDAVGECCIRAPEHSDAFNRTIKLYQTMAALGVPITASSGSAGKYGNDRPAESTSGAAGATTNSSSVPAPKKGINVKDIMKNPALAKLLVTAAKRLTEHQKKEAAEQSGGSPDAAV